MRVETSKNDLCSGLANVRREQWQWCNLFL